MEHTPRQWGRIITWMKEHRKEIEQKKAIDGVMPLYMRDKDRLRLPHTDMAVLAQTAADLGVVFHGEQSSASPVDHPHSK